MTQKKKNNIINNPLYDIEFLIDRTEIPRIQSDRDEITQDTELPNYLIQNLESPTIFAGTSQKEEPATSSTEMPTYKTLEDIMARPLNEFESKYPENYNISCWEPQSPCDSIGA